MRAAKTDANQPVIVKELRLLGYSVEIITPRGRGGVTDLLVGKHRLNHLVEVKVPGKKLSPKQERWHAAWNGCIHTGRTSSQIIEALTLCELWHTPERTLR